MVSSHVLRVESSSTSLSGRSSSSSSRMGLAKHKALATPGWLVSNLDKWLEEEEEQSRCCCCPWEEWFLEDDSNLRVRKISSLLVSGVLRLLFFFFLADTGDDRRVVEVAPASLACATCLAYSRSGLRC